jgi:arachidonate 15-lipoxygenase
MVGSFLWNYQLWIDRQPLRVYRDGRREPIDIYNRFFNANFILNVDRTKLMDDFSYLALDERGRNAMRIFRAELRALDAEMTRQPRAVEALPGRPRSKHQRVSAALSGGGAALLTARPPAS